MNDGDRAVKVVLFRNITDWPKNVSCYHHYFHKLVYWLTTHIVFLEDSNLGSGNEASNRQQYMTDNYIPTEVLS